MDLFDKCRTYTIAKEVMAAGFYPYFRVVESAQDPEVMVAGKKMIMLGSNNYLGLTNHPKVKEAAIAMPNVWERMRWIAVPERHARYSREAGKEARFPFSERNAA